MTRWKQFKFRIRRFGEKGTIEGMATGFTADVTGSRHSQLCRLEPEEQPLKLTNQN